MKISLNTNYNNSYSYKKQINKNHPAVSDIPKQNPAFGKNINMKLLLDQSRWLRGAYSDELLLPQDEINDVLYKVMGKRTNALSALHLLDQYSKYIHGTEREVYEIISESDNTAKKDFQDILKELLPFAKERQNEKNMKIIAGTEPLLQSYPAELQEKIIPIRDEALKSLENGTFNRLTPLNKLKNIRISDKALLDEFLKLYYAWYQFGRPTNDRDAFITLYSDLPHQAILRRLILAWSASIEHLKAKTDNGTDILGNLALCAKFINNDRNNLSLDKYSFLNPQFNIPENLQKYVDSIINNLKCRKSRFIGHENYPVEFKESIYNESNGKIVLDLNGYKPPVNKKYY